MATTTKVSGSETSRVILEKAHATFDGTALHTWTVFRAKLELHQDEGNTPISAKGKTTRSEVDIVTLERVEKYMGMFERGTELAVIETAQEPKLGAHALDRIGAEVFNHALGIKDSFQRAQAGFIGVHNNYAELIGHLAMLGNDLSNLIGSEDAWREHLRSVAKEGRPFKELRRPIVRDYDEFD